MTQLGGSSDWINAYLEWTGAESVMMEVDDGAEQSAAIYLEWIDSAPAVTQRAPVAVADPLREAILLMALRTETECMHILRQVLEDGRADSQTLRQAMGALQNVEADALALSGRVLELRAH